MVHTKKATELLLGLLPTSLALTIYDRLLHLDPIEWCEQLREDIQKWEAQRNQMAAESTASGGEAVLVSSTHSKNPSIT